jgi:hypothetical protein
VPLVKRLQRHLTPHNTATNLLVFLLWEGKEPTTKLPNDQCKNAKYNPSGAGRHPSESLLGGMMYALGG